MEEAIRKVLDLLEQGKLTPEEAEKLIRAIKETESSKEKTYKETSKSERSTKAGFGIPDILDEVFTNVGETIRTSISSAFEVAQRHQEFESQTFENINELNIKVFGGDLEIKPIEGEKIVASFKGNYNVEGDSLYLNIIDEGKLEVPQGINLNLAVLGGDVEIKGYYPEINLNVKGGDVGGEVDFNKLIGKVMGGDIELKTPEKPLRLQAKVLGGDLEIPSVMKKSGDYYAFGNENFREAEIKIMGGSFTFKFEED